MGILLGYEVLAGMSSASSIGVFALAFGYIPHALILFIMAIVSAVKKNGYGKVYALTALATLVIGFGACTAVFLTATAGGF